MTYTLSYQGQALHTANTWQEVADVALHNGFAIRVFNCIFQLLPGVKIT